MSIVEHFCWNQISRDNRINTNSILRIENLSLYAMTVDLEFMMVVLADLNQIIRRKYGRGRENHDRITIRGKPQMKHLDRMMNVEL